MVEATVTLKKGGALVVISENWADLMKALEGYEITGINAHEVGAAKIHPRNQAKQAAIPREDRCICCGEAVPEGRQICPACEKKGGMTQ